MATKKKTSKSKNRPNAELVKAIRDDLVKTFKPLFAGIDKRFDDSEKRFDGIDKRFDDSDKRSDERFVRIEHRLRGIDTQLGKISADLHDHTEKILGAFDGLTPVQEHGETLKNHEKRIGTVEQETTVLKVAFKNLKDV